MDYLFTNLIFLLLSYRDRSQYRASGNKTENTTLPAEIVDFPATVLFPTTTECVFYVRGRAGFYSRRKYTNTWILEK